MIVTRDTASPDAAAGGAPEQFLPPDRELHGGRQSPAQPRLPDQLQSVVDIFPYYVANFPNLILAQKRLKATQSWNIFPPVVS